MFFRLDDVQFTQGANKHNWTSRVRIGTANGPRWLSLPVRRSGIGRQLIVDLHTDDTLRWLPKMLGTLESSYGKAPYADACLRSGSFAAFRSIGAPFARPTYDLSGIFARC